MKLRDMGAEVDNGMSRPVWGAWIEIVPNQIAALSTARRAPYGARGLKSRMVEELMENYQVAPRMGRVD